MEQEPKQESHKWPKIRVVASAVAVLASVLAPLVSVQQCRHSERQVELVEHGVQQDAEKTKHRADLVACVVDNDIDYPKGMRNDADTLWGIDLSYAIYHRQVMDAVVGEAIRQLNEAGAKDATTETFHRALEPVLEGVRPMVPMKSIKEVTPWLSNQSSWPSNYWRVYVKNNGSRAAQDVTFRFSAEGYAEGLADEIRVGKKFVVQSIAPGEAFDFKVWFKDYVSADETLVSHSEGKGVLSFADSCNL